ncbi:MAG: sigma-70 family RNA polymerase sigma factor [Syntrophomonadaceae bacterium]|nr:sigma-70 family RNA polymerase sigma factor [Syntrophomonadaceae bacterium]
MEGISGKEGVKVWDDQLWLRDFVANDDTAFEALVKHYQNYVFAIILNFTGPDEAPDIAQEVFLAIYRSLPGFKPHNLKAWIGKVTVNKVIDWKRRRSRSELEHLQIDISTTPAEAGSDPEEMLLEEEKQRLLREVCQSLPPVYQRAVNKYYYEKKSYQQIAREEGVSVKTVESRLYRARVLIRQRWKEVVE